MKIPIVGTAIFLAATSSVNSRSFASFGGSGNYGVKPSGTNGFPNQLGVSGGSTVNIDELKKIDPSHYKTEADINNLIGELLDKDSDITLMDKLFGETSESLINFMSNGPCIPDQYSAAFHEKQYYEKIDDINDRVKLLKVILDTGSLLLDDSIYDLLHFLEKNAFIRLHYQPHDDHNINSFDFIKEQKQILGVGPLKISIFPEIRFVDKIKIALHKNSDQFPLEI